VTPLGLVEMFRRNILPPSTWQVLHIRQLSVAPTQVYRRKVLGPDNGSLILSSADGKALLRVLSIFSRYVSSDMNKTWRTDHSSVVLITAFDSCIYGVIDHCKLLVLDLTSTLLWLSYGALRVSDGRRGQRWIVTDTEGTKVFYSWNFPCICIEKWFITFTGVHNPLVFKLHSRSPIERG